MNNHILTIVYVSLRVFLLATILVILPVYADQSNDNNLPQTVMQGLKLQGQGRFRYFGLHVYDAAYYVDSTVSSEKRLWPIKRYALALRYARDLIGEKIATRSDEEMARIGYASAAERANWLTQMKALFPNVKVGDALTGVVAADQATRFFHNGKLLGEIKDERFAHAFFGIWLDEKTSAPSLRQALIGKSSAAPATSAEQGS